jgi:hypothetical protein
MQQMLHGDKFLVFLAVQHTTKNAVRQQVLLGRLPLPPVPAGFALAPWHAICGKQALPMLLCP